MEKEERIFALESDFGFGPYIDPYMLVEYPHYPDCSRPFIAIPKKKIEEDED